MIIFCVFIKICKKIYRQFLKYSKGLKYFLTDFLGDQDEIEKFISKCKENEDENGFIKSSF